MGSIATTSKKTNFTCSPVGLCTLEKQKRYRRCLHAEELTEISRPLSFFYTTTDIHLPRAPCKHMLSWSEELLVQASHLSRSIWPQAGQEKKWKKGGNAVPWNPQETQWLFKNKLLPSHRGMPQSVQRATSNRDKVPNWWRSVSIAQVSPWVCTKVA